MKLEAFVLEPPEPPRLTLLFDPSELIDPPLEFEIETGGKAAPALLGDEEDDDDEKKPVNRLVMLMFFSIPLFD